MWWTRRRWRDSTGAEVDALVDRDPPPAGKVGFHHYFRPPSELSASFRALREAGVLALAEELVAPLSVDLAVDHIQIATSIYGWEHEPGGGRITATASASSHIPVRSRAHFPQPAVARALDIMRSAAPGRCPSSAGRGHPLQRSRAP